MTAAPSGLISSSLLSPGAYAPGSMPSPLQGWINSSTSTKSCGREDSGEMMGSPKEQIGIDDHASAVRQRPPADGLDAQVGELQTLEEEGLHDLLELVLALRQVQERFLVRRLDDVGEDAASRDFGPAQADTGRLPGRRAVWRARA